jgi:hypothetical protein
MPLANQRLGVALDGCGRFGDFCLSVLGELPQLPLAGVTDRDHARVLAAAGQRGITAYPHYAALLADDHVDIAFVATPPADHAPMTLAAIGAGNNGPAEGQQQRPPPNSRSSTRRHLAGRGPTQGEPLAPAGPPT